MLVAIVIGVRDVCVRQKMGSMVRIRLAGLLFYVICKEIFCMNSMSHCTWKIVMFSQSLCKNKCWQRIFGNLLGHGTQNINWETVRDEWYQFDDLWKYPQMLLGGFTYLDSSGVYGNKSSCQEVITLEWTHWWKIGGKPHGVEQGLARGDCMGWGHLFLSARLTVLEGNRTEPRLRSASEFRGEATPTAIIGGGTTFWCCQYRVLN